MTCYPIRFPHLLGQDADDHVAHRYQLAIQLVCLLWLCVGSSTAAAEREPGIEFFEKKIRPVLSKHCHQCHAAKAEQPRGELLLDSRAGLLRGGASGRALVPGQPMASLLIEALRWESLEMPPAGKLPAEVIADFVDWIAMGAPLPADDEFRAPRATQSWLEQRERRALHWSWQPLRGRQPPEVAGANPPAHPLDRFIVARLAVAGLEQAEMADRRTLIRRLHFVLLGTPPNRGELNRFVRDPRPDEQVWQRAVDRLLAAPAFGERWARHWMDVVRYAETHGSEHDAVIPKSWRYRDYLIRAFNSDLPYDRFVREHLAGDILSNARWNENLKLNEAALATAWLRMTEFYHSPVDVKNEEAAVVENLIDTFGKAFQAQTLACARCHDHKFDAISAHDYYALYGIFTSGRQGMLIADRPQMFHQHDAEIRELKRRVRRLLAARWRQQLEEWPTAINAALQALARQPQSRATGDQRATWCASLASSKAASLDQALYPLAQLARIRESGAAWQSQWQAVQQRMRGALAAAGLSADHRVFADLRGDDLAAWHGQGPGFAQRTAVSAGAFALCCEGDGIVSSILPAGVYSHLVSPKHGGSLRSPKFRLDSKFISALVMGEGDSRLRLVVENFQGDTILFAPAMPRLKTDRSPRWIRLPVRKQWIGASAYLELLGRDDDPYIGIMGKEKPGMEKPSDGRSSCGLLAVVFHDKVQTPRPVPIWHPSLSDRQHSTLEQVVLHFVATVRTAIDAWATDSASDQQAQLLNALLQAGHLPNTSAGQAKLTELLERYRELERQIPVPRRVPAMMDEGPGQDAAFFPRGNHRTPGARIPRRYLEVLGSDRPSFGSAGGSGRHELAQAIASEHNPLTARVIVNRLWHWTFGRGLVSTVDNFGSTGAGPTHSELLDYLATRFIDRGWSIKDTIRFLVTSRTFRLRSEAAARALEIDPENRLLQHAHVRRLDGESIRDSILAVAGSLDRRMFGPAVPVWLAESHVSNHKPQNGPLNGDGRRSIYLEVRRNNPYAFFRVFNRPQPTLATGAREVTTVPAQSLALLNDPFVIDQAHEWARSLIDKRPQQPLKDLLSAMYEQLFGRPATAVELSRAQEFLREQARHYTLTPAQYYEDPRPLRDLAHALLNHKEFIYLR